MNKDKLKEIRATVTNENEAYVPNINVAVYSIKEVESIQIATVNAVIEEVEIFLANAPVEMRVLGMDLKDALEDKLNELKT